MTSLANVCEIDVPEQPAEYYRCLDRKLRDRWNMTAVRMRLLQATAISLLIGLLTLWLEGHFILAVSSIVTVNVILLADVYAVHKIEVNTSGFVVTMREDGDEDNE